MPPPAKATALGNAQVALHVGVRDRLIRPLFSGPSPLLRIAASPVGRGCPYDPIDPENDQPQAGGIASVHDAARLSA